MPAAKLLIDAVRDHLITAGLVRDPRTAGPLPPCWRSPRNGVPAPGDGTTTEKGATVVVGLFPASGIARDPYDASVLRSDGVDIRIRATTPPAAIQLDDLIRAQLMDRRAWSMGGLEIVESRLERPFNLVVSDEQGYDYISGWIFERAA
jgi:hypothetical protein